MRPAAHPQTEHAWAQARDRLGGFALIVPGDPAFLCQAELCSAHCCKAFSVALRGDEVTRLERLGRVNRQRFLECEGGEPIALPLADPFLLAREDGHCAMLGADLRCTVYDARPNACRLYPHQVVFVEPGTGRRVTNVSHSIYRKALAGGDEALVPLLLRHLECPGFTGPPMQESEWAALFVETYRLQYRDQDVSLQQPLPA